MFEDNLTYYKRRSAQAAELADRATEPKIAAIHQEMALRYAIRSNEVEVRQNVVALKSERSRRTARDGALRRQRVASA